MNGIILGVTLMAVGMGMLFASLVRNKKVRVTASNGSMAVGRDNSGVMMNVNQSNAAPQPKGHGNGLTVLAIIVELAGIGVTVWHALHLVGK